MVVVGATVVVVMVCGGGRSYGSGGYGSGGYGVWWW